MSSKHFCVRVTHKKDNLEKIPECLSDILKNHSFVKCLVVAHLRREDNQHSHIVLDLADSIKQQSLRYFFTKYFEPRSYSLKVSDDSLRRYSYLFHEKASEENIIFKYNVSQDDLALYMQMCTKVQDAMPDRGKKSNLIKDIVSKYKSRYFLDQTNCSTDGFAGKMLEFHSKKVFVRIMNLILGYYTEFVPSGYQMERYVMTCMRELYQEDFGEFYYKFHFSRKMDFLC